MKLLANLILILPLMSLSGCAVLKNLTQKTASNHVSYPSLQTFELEGAVIYYKDLSSPCDESTVAWNDLNKASPIHQASLKVVQIDCDEIAEVQQRYAVERFEVQKQLSVPFETSKSELIENGNAKQLDNITELATTNTKFQIHGAAGTVGTRSEALGLDRALAVKDHLMKLGVKSERIEIMPYDPSIPGLQALVKVLAPVIL